MEILESEYYSPHDLLSRNCLINMIVGERGNGKTYAFKKWCIDDYIKNHNQFIWVRRYDTEFDDIALFFDDIYMNYENKVFRCKGGKFFMIDNDKEEVIGYYFPLSKAKTKKSIPYPKVTKIIFDEFLIDKGNYHYLPREVECFLDLYSTIARSRDVRTFLIANSTSSINPYFIFFKVKINGRFTKCGDDVIVERTENLAYREKMKQTRFGRIVSGTDYEKYAIQNEFIHDNKEFIEKKSKNAIPRFNLKVENETVGIWVDTKEGKYYASFSHDPSYCTYTLLFDDMRPNMVILTSKNNNFTTLKKAIQYGILYYDSMRVKGIMQKVIELLNIK